MFISSRFLRSVRPQPASTMSASTPSILHTLIKPIFAGRCRPLLLLFNRPGVPTILGLDSRRQMCHHGNGDRGGKKGGKTSIANFSEKCGKRIGSQMMQKNGGNGAGRGGNHSKGGSGGGGGGKGGGGGGGAAAAGGGGHGPGTGGGAGYHNGVRRPNVVPGGAGGEQGKEGGYQTVSPSTIQVFSDPTLARTVREVAVVLQRVRNQVKNVKEDTEDCAFELVKQGQNQRTMDKILREASTQAADATKRLEAHTTELRVMERNLVFFSKMSASHDNQLRDSILRLNECERRLEAALGRLDSLGASLTHLKRMLYDDVKSELRDLRLSVRLARGDSRTLRDALVREGITVEPTRSEASTAAERKDKDVEELLKLKNTELMKLERKDD